MIDITSEIRSGIRKSKIQEEIAVIYCPHTTAGITIDENDDLDVVKDLIYGFEKVYPTKCNKYQHFEGNFHTHMKSSTM